MRSRSAKHQDIRKDFFMRIFLCILLIVLGLCIDAYCASLMKKVAIAKGYEENNHIWSICFCLGIIGYLYVIALPDLIQQSQNQKIIKLLEAKNEKQ